MCGIVGLAGKQDPSWLPKMNALVAHRGPDDFGEYHDREAEVAIAARRLSIRDLTGGHQPMSNEDGTVWIVFNGEIYNSPEIRGRLIAKGYRFVTTTSDTEVLLHLYEEKREAMLQDLNGMFAFVVYDRARRLLFGARDRVGIKPLYYSRQPGLFAFGSELKSLLALPTIKREVHRQSLFHYMTLLYIPGEGTIFSDIRRLAPGHWFQFDVSTRKLTLQSYWRPDVRRAENRSEAEWCALIRHELREAVRRWTLSDVPLACSLSGGIDSATIVGLLSEIGHKRVKTYSLGFTGEEETRWNELNLARQVAKRWDTDHHEIVLQPEELLNDLVQMVWHLDEPYGGGLPSWYVFRLMSNDVKVALTGTGGDELFGNYGKFSRLESSPVLRVLLKRPGLVEAGRRLPSWVWSAWRKAAGAIPDNLVGIPRKQRLMELEQLCGAPFGHHYHAYFSDGAKRETVFNGACEGVDDTEAYLQRLFDEARTTSARDGVAYVDFQTQLSEEYLMMTDRLSMAHSLEARVPFLDHAFVEMVLRIPSAIRTRPDDLKYLLKKAIGDLLPEDILGARKRGFMIPIGLWLRGKLRPLAIRLLSPERLRRQGIFRPSFYQRYVQPHLEGQSDYSYKVWVALMFQLWHVVFIEQNARYTPTYRWRDIV